MRRLSGCAQGSKSSDSKPSRSAFRLLQQQGGAWHCGAVSRSGGGNTRCTVQGSESGHAVCTLDRRVRVEQYSASRGGIACHAGRGEGSASGGSFLCASACFACSVRAAVHCAICLLSEIVNCEMARLGPSFVTRCDARLHRGPLIAVTKNSHVRVAKS